MRRWLQRRQEAHRLAQADVEAITAQRPTGKPAIASVT